MAGVEEVKAGCSQANQKIEESFAGIQKTALDLEEAQAALNGAIYGTSQDEMQHCYGMLAEVLQTLGGVQGTLRYVRQTIETYVHGL